MAGFLSLAWKLSRKSSMVMFGGFGKYASALYVAAVKANLVEKRYVLRIFISLKHITANVVDRNHGHVVATSSTAEHSIKQSLESGRSCNAKAAAVVGEILAMRLKVEGLKDGQGRGIYVNVTKEIKKKGFKSQTKVWAIVNALKNNGVKLIDEDDGNDSSPSHS
ncbi:uncharacterized protein LOC107623504 isoform X2 [Arachis ipaensis]|nr:uncharacterized protein LOC107623504 isoform X2 [Arachis ipaensis]XP_025681130.1 uncharacterized protein LOC112782775 isoform X2 [Arachis hypogaea]XP_025681131.1 uncharacterized protein LOC112782775 isoform X2 [Arachis hypogaea]XP_025681132.1 uncharacterized protein LOC112782775 isoform X2 [Arachis hypogaea]